MDADTVTTIAEMHRQPQIEDRGEKQFAFVPEGYRVEDISRYLAPPDRIQQSVELLNIPSLIAYVNGYKGQSTVVFADESRAFYDVILDYHDAVGTRGNKDHVARYQCPQSDSWRAWTAQNGPEKKLTQADFGKFIEANLIDIVSPPGAEMLEIALSLQVNKSAKFESDMRLDNGQTQFGYTEQVSGTTKNKSLQIPDTFRLGIPVFIDGDAYPLDARLRYRLDDEKLWLWYELVRPNDVYRAAVKAVSESIRTGLPDVQFWIGKRS
jgi:uncharacterized protein YfdQ (DUF2303 family)